MTELDTRVEAEGASLGEAKFAAMKELEPRFPGITVECVRFEVASEGDGDEPARVVGEVDEDAWRDVAEADLPEEPAERLRAVVTRVVQTLALDATVDVQRDRGGAARHGRGRGPRPADRQARRRPSTPCSTSRCGSPCAAGSASR